ncbi:MAG: hypothetical protein GF355_07295 [Candidatus Eisenbacteria bacterium]|nr:hypothetical protein [Candidatus Eisenbacteria bacterium]
MQERRQILDMLAEGKITPEEAERLLEKLASGSSAVEATLPQDARERPGSDSASGESARATPKFLRVLVNSNDGHQVNVRIPMELIRTGIKLGAMIPDDARQHLHEKGIDLSQLSGMDQEELIQALRDLVVDVDSDDGDTVRIFCE